MRWARTFILIAVAAGVAGALAAAEPAPSPVGEVEKETGLFRHTGRYPPLGVTWRADGRVEGAVGVFPHVVLPRRVVLATTRGLFLSDDAGDEWQPLAQASADRVGVVRHVAFSPESPDTFYLATDHKGIWATTDAGKAFSQIGAKATGLVSDDTVAVCVYRGDPQFRTLMVVHGDAGAGLSVTRDLGRTWQVAGADYYVRGLLGGYPGDTAVFLVAARKAAPDLLSIYHAVSIDDYWMEMVKDVVPTGAAVSVLYKQARWTEEVFHGAEPYFSTADDGLYHLSQTGGVRVSPPDVTSLASVGITWGPHADSQVIYAYEPRRLGMVVSADGFASVSKASAGLYTGPFVKEGAHIRASAGGSRFYAVVNDRLYLGRKNQGPLAVAEATVTPPVLTFQATAYKNAVEGLREDMRRLGRARSAAAEAKRLLETVRGARAFLSCDRVTITARVAAPGGRPASVTVDLSRLGGRGLTPMYDDGGHGDGQADDGVWGAVAVLNPQRFKSDTRDWRGRCGGKMGLTVTAASADGTLASEVAALELLARIESFDVSRSTVPIEVKGGPWTKRLGDLYNPVDISEYAALAFRVRTALPAGEEMAVQLQDLPAYSPAVTTPRVPILKEGLVEGGAIDGQWRPVVIPMRRLLRDAKGFRADRWTFVVLSGDGKSPGTYEMADMRFLVNVEEAKAFKGATKP